MLCRISPISHIMYEAIIPLYYVHYFDVLKVSLRCVKGADSQETAEMNTTHILVLSVLLTSEDYKRVDLDFIRY